MKRFMKLHRGKIHELFHEKIPGVDSKIKIRQKFRIIFAKISQVWTQPYAWGWVGGLVGVTQRYRGVGGCI